MARATQQLVDLPDETAVVVAGGGPVGLATAVELAHHGASCVVVEPRPEVSWLRPRAKTTSARTMEHLRRWGLADELRERAPLPVAWSDEAVFCTAVLGREIARFDGCFGLDLAGSDLVAECGQQVAQPIVEQLLREAVDASATAVLATGLRVTEVGVQGGGVVVEVADDEGGTRRIGARYAVGCEGARSVVREAMGARYEGSDSQRPNFNIVFRSAGLAARVPHGPAIHYWVLNPSQPGLVGRLDLDETWWCGAVGVDAESGSADPARIVANLLGEDLGVEVLATDAWRARMLLCDHYASGPLFVAGDAAHQNPPWGGHGFNTGIGDAVNLGWKLAAVLDGWAPPELLASYEPERRPVASRTIDEAVRNMRTLSAELADSRLVGTDEEFAEARPAAAAAILATKDTEFHSLGLTLGYDYADSPIVAREPGRDASGAARGRNERYEPTAAPGHRLPHRWLAPADSLYDNLGRELTLVGDVMGAPGAAALFEAALSRHIPLSVVELPGADWRAHFGAALVLVRPDQHVAWRGDGVLDADAVLSLAIGQPESH